MFLAAALLSGPAHAATPEQDAEALLRSGVHAFDNREYEAARRDFEKAHARFPTPASLLNLALAEMNSARPLHAMVHFEEYLALPKRDGARAIKIQKEYLPPLKARLGKVWVNLAPGATLLVTQEQLEQRDPLRTRRFVGPLARPIDALPGAVEVNGIPKQRDVDVRILVDFGDVRAGETIQLRPR
jgi:tetratricopeptide (TPR) repeat protein